MVSLCLILSLDNCLLGARGRKYNLLIHQIRSGRRVAFWERFLICEGKSVINQVLLAVSEHTVNHQMNVSVHSFLSIKQRLSNKRALHKRPVKPPHDATDNVFLMLKW